MTCNIDRQALEKLYECFNRRELVSPDPLELLYNYDNPRDMEVAGLVASALAYGRVKQILSSAGEVLSRMESPARFAEETGFEKMRRTFAGFKHRFATGEQVAAMIFGAGRLIDTYGSLESAFADGITHQDKTTMPALAAFADRLRTAAGRLGHLLACPSAGSACKRLHLYLRWMVRADEVDPGCWKSVPAAMLVVPVDVHMHRICRRLGLTSRSQADIKTALEITDAFRRFSPDDPVRYDFALTRLGIREDVDPEHFFSKYAVFEVTY